MEIIPALYVLNGKLVALYKGNYEQKVTYFKSPLEMLQHFRKEGAKKMHIVDLDGCKNCEFAQKDLIGRLVKSTEIPLQVESGYKTLADIDEAFQLGVAKVVLRTCAYPIMKEALAKYGPEKIVIEIHAKGSEIVHPEEAKAEPEDVVDFAEKLILLGVREIVYKDERSEGTMIHPNYDEVDRLVLVTGQALQIYVSGGIGDIKHLLLLKKIGASGAIIGKAFFENMLSLKEAERAVI